MYPISGIECKADAETRSFFPERRPRQNFCPHASREQEKVHVKAISARNMAGKWLEADFFDLSEQSPAAGLDPIQDLQVE